MTRVPRTALLLAAALAALARAASAQTVPSPIQDITSKQGIQAFAGYLFTDRGVGINDSTEVDMGPSSAPVFGLSYEYRAAGGLNLQAQLGLSPGTRRLFAPSYNADSTRVDAVDLDAEVPTAVLMGDVGLLFHLTGARTWNNLAPFVVARGGIAADIRGTFQEEVDEGLVQDQFFRFGPSFAVGAGLGTDWFPRRSLSLRAELQGRLWRMSPPQAFLIPRTDRAEYNQVGGLTVGAVFHF
jgi:opacity protein-like surface antigen